MRTTPEEAVLCWRLIDNKRRLRWGGSGALDTGALDISPSSQDPPKTSSHERRPKRHECQANRCRVDAACSGEGQFQQFARQRNVAIWARVTS